MDRYLAAVAVLFDPAESRVQLKSIAVTSPTEVRAVWTLEGTLKFPWHPKVAPFEGVATYKVNKDGLVESQTEVWDISPLVALRETFTPGPSRTGGSPARQ